MLMWLQYFWLSMDFEEKSNKYDNRECKQSTIILGVYTKQMDPLN